MYDPIVCQRELLGVTSYLGLQDLVSRMLQTKLAYTPTYFENRQSAQVFPEQANFDRNDLWRWGCNVYM
jgi:hypothetical protein